MKTSNFLFIGLIFFIFFVGCETKEPFLEYETPNYLISDVYDIDDRLVAHYEYDKSYNLIKRIFTDPVNNVASNMIFHYKNGYVSMIEHKSYDFPQFDHQEHFIYDENGRLTKIERYQREELLSFVNTYYDNNGKIKSLNSNGFEPFVFFEYDTKNNVNKSTYHLIEPETKEEFIQVRERAFDTFKRPSMGLDYLLGVDPLPWRYYMDVWELTLSQNNIVADHHSGNTFTYEYNNDGYPVSVTVKWKDIETEKPLTMKIKYLKKK